MTWASPGLNALAGLRSWASGPARPKDTPDLTRIQQIFRPGRPRAQCSSGPEVLGLRPGRPKRYAGFGSDPADLPARPAPKDLPDLARSKRYAGFGRNRQIFAIFSLLSSGPPPWARLALKICWFRPKPADLSPNQPAIFWILKSSRSRVRKTCP